MIHCCSVYRVGVYNLCVTAYNLVSSVTTCELFFITTERCVKPDLKLLSFTVGSSRVIKVSRSTIAIGIGIISLAL